MDTAPGIAATSLSFAAVLGAAMGLATIGGAAIGVLATFLIDEFDITRSDVGTLIAAFAIVGAIASPGAGRLADLLGGRRSVLAVYLVAILVLAGMATAPTFLLLLLASGAGGFANGLTNPATNKAIATLVPTGQRGLITGIKQSGVQLGVFLAGLLLPPVADRFGWRTGVGGLAVLGVLGLVAAHFRLPREEGRDVVERRPLREPHAPVVWWLTLYSFLMGLGTGSITAFIALFAEEEVGMDVRAAGLVLGLTGLVALGGRIGWGIVSERHTGYFPALAMMAALATGAAGLLVAAPHLGSAAVWVAAVLVGFSVGSWNTVAMLAVMHTAGPAQAGRGSGLVVLGFLGGFGLGPRGFGGWVDAVGSYGPAWGGVVVGFAAALGVALLWMSWGRRRLAVSGDDCGA